MPLFKQLRVCINQVCLKQGCLVRESRSALFDYPTFTVEDGGLGILVIKVCAWAENSGAPAPVQIESLVEGLSYPGRVVDGLDLAGVQAQLKEFFKRYNAATSPLKFAPPKTAIQPGAMPEPLTPGRECPPESGAAGSGVRNGTLAGDQGL